MFPYVSRTPVDVIEWRNIWSLVYNRGIFKNN